MTDLGPGKVFLANQQTVNCGRVELLAGGAIRTAEITHWSVPGLAESCAAESRVEYFGPTAWESFAPAAEENGTLTVCVDDGKATIIGTCLTEPQAFSAAADHLRRNYQDAEAFANRVEAFFFSSRSTGVRLVPRDNDQQETVTFQWHTPQLARPALHTLPDPI
jgi:hypothetical protein